MRRDCIEKFDNSVLGLCQKWKHWRWLHLLRHYLPWKSDHRNHCRNRVDKIFYNSTSDLRNATDHCQVGVGLSVIKEMLPFTDKQQKESGLNLVQFHFPNQSWQDDKKLSQPHDSNNEKTRQQRLSSILSLEWEPMKKVYHFYPKSN